MPFLCASFGYSAVITGFHLSTEIYLNNYYHIQTRNFDNHDYIAGWAWVDAWENSTPSPQWNEALALHHAIGTRTYTVHYSPRGSLGAIQASLSSGGAFPTFPSNATTNAPSIRFTSGWGGNASSGIFAGMLYGIVKQGETLYYLWGTLDR
jgi:hypothetical protein